MPNRYVRASAIESEAINALSWRAEVFYRRLLNRADDFGRYTASPPLLRASLYPLQLDRITEKDVTDLLDECQSVGLIFCYEAAGKPLLVINKWEKGRAKASEYAEPPDAVCKRMLTYVYTRKQMFAHAPDSDSDTGSDSDPSDPAKPGRARDPLFDALAIADGSDPMQLTPTHAKRIGVALAQLRKACPDLNPAEIQRRSRIYASVMPSGTRCTASALAANWAKCGGSPLPSLASPAAPEVPPPAAWRTTMERLYPQNAVNREGRAWAEVPEAIKAEVMAATP